MLILASRQNGVLKVFENSGEFLEMVKEVGVSKSAIYFKKTLLNKWVGT